MPTRIWLFIHSAHDVVSNFVAASGNRYTTMHYNVVRVNARMGFQHPYASRKYRTRHAAPPGVQERNRPLPRCNEVNRHAVRDGYQQK